ncbi:MFS transporter [Micromonospora sp. NPDC002717]|uniref:MFS transporter n=1 Tax=Micromonospora sp. NPDC002717 TaxID=3154424 RepID=UPI00331CCD1A
MPRNRPVVLLSVGHACVDVYQGAVASLVPYFIAERQYGYAAASGIVLAASLLSSVAQPLFGALTDRRPSPWLLPVSTVLGGLGIALSGIAGSYALTLLFVAVSGIGVAAYHPESARLARIASRGSHAAMGWFALGGNLGFAAAPVLVALVVAHGGLRLTPLLVLPALVGSALCLPVLRALGDHGRVGGGTSTPTGTDDRASFVRLSLAVACRSILFVGLSTFVSVHAELRTGGGRSAAPWRCSCSTSAARWAPCSAESWPAAGGGSPSRAGRTWAPWPRRRASCSSPAPRCTLFVALTSVGLAVPFSLQVTLGQDYLPTRVGTASGITLGLAVSIGGLASPLIGSVADATSLQAALAPLPALPALAWLLFRALPEPASGGNARPPSAPEVGTAGHPSARLG